jgi:uncharacterized FAD-dependent dehydrogenase
MNITSYSDVELTAEIKKRGIFAFCVNLSGKVYKKTSKQL